MTQYLDQIFGNFPQTKEVLAYRENLCAQMEVVFNAELASGKTGEEAMSVVISSAPNYEEIYAALNIGEISCVCNAEEYRKRVKSCSFWYALAIALFVASPFGMIGLSVWKHMQNLVAGLVILFFSVGVGIGMLIYATREKRILRELKPETSLAPARIWSLIVGILFCALALFELGFCLHVLNGKVLSRECASSLIDLALGVLFLLYYAGQKRWFSR